MKRIFVCAVFMAAGAQPMPACDLCSVYAASEAQGGDGRGFFAGVADQFTRFGSLQSDGRTVANDSEHINSLNSQLFIGYNFNERFGAQINLPLIYREYSRQYTSVEDGHVYSPERHSETGIGDLSLTNRHGLFHPVEEAVSDCRHAIRHPQFRCVRLSIRQRLDVERRAGRLFVFG
jgi:hypothetical protein